MLAGPHGEQPPVKKQRRVSAKAVAGGGAQPAARTKESAIAGSFFRRNAQTSLASPSLQQVPTPYIILKITNAPPSAAQLTWAPWEEDGLQE